MTALRTISGASSKAINNRSRQHDKNQQQLHQQHNVRKAGEAQRQQRAVATATQAKTIVGVELLEKFTRKGVNYAWF